MKKFVSFLITLISCVSTYAQNPLDEVSGGIAIYTPVAKGVIYALAGVVAVISCMVIYIKSQNEGNFNKKDVYVTVGSCLFLVCSATALPEFFGLDDASINSGHFASNSETESGFDNYGGSGSTGGGSYEGFESQPINPAIPGLDDPIWTPEPNSSAFTQDWMEKNGVNSYGEIIENAKNDAFHSGNNLGESGLSNYGSDVLYLLQRFDGDWNKAIRQADNDITWAYAAEENGDPMPYSHREYESIYEGLLAAYKYMHGYDYSS